MGEGPPSPRQRRRRVTLSGLGKRIQERRRAGAEDEAAAPESKQRPEAEAAAPRRSPDPAAPGARVGRPAAPAPSPKSRHELAVERFNRSEHARTVAGLTRTLGPPFVSVGAAAGAPSEIRITVAWELSWYQWIVDVRDESRAIYEVAKGFEMDELDGPAREWNAHALAEGQLVLGGPPQSMVRS